MAKDSGNSIAYRRRRSLMEGVARPSSASSLAMVIAAGMLAAFAIAVTVGWPLIVSAIHDDGNFELEGNIADEAATGPDWESVFDATGNVAVIDGGLAA